MKQKKIKTNTNSQKSKETLWGKISKTKILI